MTETDRLMHRVRSYLAQPGVSKAGLAEASGLHKNALRGADRPDWNPTADTLRKVERALPVEMVEVMTEGDKPDDIEASATNGGKIIRAARAA
jgi:ribosome-binding protein aMBF1 (putative translation factor)